jgi:hypothetical protein
MGVNKAVTKHFLLHKEEEGEVWLGINEIGGLIIRVEVEGDVMYFHGDNFIVILRG